MSIGDWSVIFCPVDIFNALKNAKTGKACGVDDYDYDYEITLFEHKQNQHIHIIIVRKEYSV